MPKTHESLILKSEERLLTAMIHSDKETLNYILHPNIVLTNENGEVFIGVKTLNINNPNILKFDSINVIERTITTFDSIINVNTFEKRAGNYLGFDFDSYYRINRIWKFQNRWRLIGTTIIRMSE